MIGSCERQNVDTLCPLRFCYAPPYRASGEPTLAVDVCQSASRMCRDCPSDVQVGHQTRCLPVHGTKYRHTCTYTHARTHTDITGRKHLHTHEHTHTRYHMHNTPSSKDRGMKVILRCQNQDALRSALWGLRTWRGPTHPKARAAYSAEEHRNHGGFWRWSSHRGFCW